MSIFGKSRKVFAVGFAIAIVATGAVAQDATPQRHAPAYLAAGDDVVVMVFREKELSAKVYVDDRNQIALPRLGVLTVGAMTTQGLQDTLRTLYATFLRSPSIDVRALRRVTVNGAVMKPDVFLVEPTLSVHDLIARAGGVSPEGDSRKVAILRGGVRLPVAGGAEDIDDTPVRSGDEIVVGRRGWIALNLGTVLGVAGLLTTLALAFRR